MTDLGETIVVRATLRSVGGFVVTLLMSLFWNGIVSIFVLWAAMQLFQHLVGPLPAWLPTPFANEQKQFGTAVFVCLFLIPFLTIGAGMVGAVFMNALGKVEVHIGDDQAHVSTGVGIFVWRRRFDPNQVRRVSAGLASWQLDSQAVPLIVIDADLMVKFGTLLAYERREWLQAMLQELLTTRAPLQRKKLLTHIMTSISKADSNFQERG